MLDDVIEVDIPGSQHMLLLNRNNKGLYSYSLLLNQGISMSLCHFSQVLDSKEKLQLIPHLPKSRIDKIHDVLENYQYSSQIVMDLTSLGFTFVTFSFTSS